MGSLESRLSDLVSRAVEKAVGTVMEAAKKQGGEMKSLESMLFSMKNEQAHFQSEIRSTVTNLGMWVTYLEAIWEFGFLFYLFNRIFKSSYIATKNIYRRMVLTK